ncbi:hypothetical protein N1031_07020 [Herbiconiux moechotypicola]|uniref:Uncharacterized protein n=1 Tax=Herbiconiux moechotypicola TaxID=637393 RepID=A0ABN3DGA5_9MICO|nr:hypothetical protein [Herbiconiux moechotypicola]MCS5729508.1 hypothetical protein [Herbiconiux moechotypicola]
MNLYNLIEAEGLVPVAGLSGGGYAWGRIEVYYSPRASRFYWLHESGCSCYHFGDAEPYSLGDFSDGDRAAAIGALKGFSHYEGDPSKEEYDRETAKVRDYRPEVTA